MTRILVTGSSGFIGYHLCNFLSKKFEVFGVDNHNNYYSKNLKSKRLNILKKNKKFKFRKIDLNNKSKLKKIFFDFKPEIIFHLAGQPGVLYSFKNPRSYYKNNVDATRLLCNLTKEHNVKKFILGSSSSVYGDQEKFPITENFNLKPKNPYAKTKYSSEKITKKILKNSNTNFIIFRFFTVYGPLGRPDMFIHKFLNSLNKNLLIKLHNGGSNFRDFTYVGDVINILSKVIKKKLKNETINICRSKPIITNRLVSLIIKIYKTKKKPKIQKIDFVKGEMLKTHGSNKKLKKEFGNIKFTDIKKGLNETIKVYKKLKF